MEGSAADRSEGPGATVFQNPGSLVSSIIVATAHAVFSCGLRTPEETRAAEEAIRRGADPSEALGQGVKVIPWGTIRRVQTNLYSPYLTIRFSRADDKPFSEEFGFESLLSRDRFLEALEKRLMGSFKFKRVTRQYGRIRGAVAPGVTILSLLLATWLLRSAALEAVAEKPPVIQSAREGRVLWILSVLGPTGVTVLGVLAATMAAAWLIARMLKPPNLVTLIPDQAPRIIR